jgi:hypothetical protein
MSIRIEVAPGEIIDKLTILEIKRERIGDEAKRKNVSHEWDVLTRDLDAAVKKTPEQTQRDQSETLGDRRRHPRLRARERFRVEIH